jgi:hypothetical protein
LGVRRKCVWRLLLLLAVHYCIAIKNKASRRLSPSGRRTCSHRGLLCFVTTFSRQCSPFSPLSPPQRPSRVSPSTTFQTPPTGQTIFCCLSGLIIIISYTMPAPSTRILTTASPSIMSLLCSCNVGPPPMLSPLITALSSALVPQTINASPDAAGKPTNPS